MLSHHLHPLLCPLERQQEWPERQCMLEEATRCTWGDVLGTFVWEDGWFLACEGVKHGGCAHMKRCKNLIFWKLATERSSRLLQMGMCWASPSTPSLVAACSGLSHVTTGVETFCETQHPATQRISLKESKRLKLSNALFAQ